MALSKAKMDIGCCNLQWSEENFVLSAGGWNNGAEKDTEIISGSKYRIEIGSDRELPPVRSSVMVELERNPMMIGGIECSKLVIAFSISYKFNMFLIMLQQWEEMYEEQQNMEI